MIGRRRRKGRRRVGGAALSLVTLAAQAVASSVAAAQSPEPDGPTTTPSARKSEVAETVRAREIAFAQTMADRDFQAFLDFISPEAVFFAGLRPLRGRDAIGEAWAPLFEGPTAPFSWEPDVVEVLDSGSLALTSGPVRDPDGNEVGRFNTVWRLDADGHWRVVFDKGS